MHKAAAQGKGKDTGPILHDSASTSVGFCRLSAQGMIMQPCMGQVLKVESYHIASGHNIVTSGMLQRVSAVVQQQMCGLDDQKHRSSCTQCMGARRIHLLLVVTVKLLFSAATGSHHVSLVLT